MFTTHAAVAIVGRELDRQTSRTAMRRTGSRTHCVPCANVPDGSLTRMASHDASSEHDQVPAACWAAARATKTERTSAPSMRSRALGFARDAIELSRQDERGRERALLRQSIKTAQG